MTSKKTPEPPSGTSRKWERTGRARRVTDRVPDTRRGWAPPRPGRAWINGDEVGGVDPRYTHLSAWLD